MKNKLAAFLKRTTFDPNYLLVKCCETKTLSMYSSKCNFPTIWNNFETTTLKSLMLTTCQNVSRNPTEIWIFDDVKTICIPLSKIFVLISALLRKKAL